MQDLKDRFLFTQALEAARCMEEKRRHRPARGRRRLDPRLRLRAVHRRRISLIDGIGAKAFVARARELAAKYGPRFEPSAGLEAMAEKGGSFYGKPAASRAA